MPPSGEALYLFFICWLLAQLEIQIEGPHGWAERLPTWRLDHPRLLALTNGKPLTGYHVYLTALLLAFFHLPLVLTGWSWVLQTKALALYLLATITWDFQWFVWNPAWGTRRFLNERVWWFPRRVARVPVEYYLTVGSSFLLTCLLWRDGAGWWLRLAGWLTAATLVSVAAAGLWRAQERS